MKPATKRLAGWRYSSTDGPASGRSQDDDPVGQRHGLDLVMGHIDHRRARQDFQLGQFHPCRRKGIRFDSVNRTYFNVMARPMTALTLAPTTWDSVSDGASLQ
jgi:hypothetical protein